MRGRRFGNSVLCSCPADLRHSRPRLCGVPVSPHTATRLLMPISRMSRVGSLVASPASLRLAPHLKCGPWVPSEVAKATSGGRSPRREVLGLSLCRTRGGRRGLGDATVSPARPTWPSSPVAVRTRGAVCSQEGGLPHLPGPLPLGSIPPVPPTPSSEHGRRV